MARRRKVRSITIIGRRWFQRGPGNTYHTAEIHVDGVCVHKTPKEYGYGDQYRETALQWLDASGLVPPRDKHDNGSHEASWEWAERIGISLTFSCSDVAREKDL